MTSISNEAVSGRATVIVSESPVRNPIGGVAFTNRVENPAVAILPTTTIRTLPDALVAAVGGALNRQPR